MRYECIIDPGRCPRRRHRMEFDSLADMRASIESAPGIAVKQTVKASGDRDESFVGRDLPQWADVWKAIEEPWQAGLEIVEQMRRELSGVIPAPVSRARRRRWNQDDGDDICRDRLASGQDYWRQSRRECVTGPQTITIVADMATSARVDAEDILWRGAAAVAMCATLEENGYRCELLGLSKTDGAYTNNDDGMLGLWMKRAGDPLDLASLTNAVSGWAYRTVWFGCYATAPAMIPCTSLGGPRKLLPEDMERFIPGPWLVVDDAWNFRAALACVREQLASLNRKEAA